MSEIITKRLGSWTRFGKPEEVEARLKRAEQIENWANNLRERMGTAPGQPGNGKPAKRELTEQDVKVRDYLETLSPGFTNWQTEKEAMVSQLQQVMEYQWGMVTERNVSSLRSWAEKDFPGGLKPEQLKGLDDMVANSIRGNQEDLRKYLTGWGAQEIVKKHYDEIVKNIKSYAGAPANVAPNATRARDAANAARLPPRMPQGGGVPAPTATKGKMSDKERIDAAFARFTGQE